MFNIGEKLKEMFNEWLKDLLESIFGFLAKALFSHEDLGGFFSTFVGVFTVFGSSLMLAIVLFRIINAILTEANFGDANVADIIISTVKASAMIAVFPAILYLVHKQIVQPLGEYFFATVADGTADIVTNIVENETTISGVFTPGSFSMLLLFAFLVIVFVVYTFKICVYHADLIILEIMSVGAAISIATEKYDFSEVWWREFLSQIVSIIVQTLMIAGIVQILSDFDSWYDFMLLVGLGVLIIRGPSALRSMWYSSGAGRGSLNAGKTVTRLMMMRSFGR